MKFYSISILLFIFSSSTVFSNSFYTSEITSNLSGKVFDAKTKEPLEGANIFIHDIRVGAISKKDGSYQINSFKSGKYLVEVSYQGYASIIDNIDISGQVVKNFYLTETVVEQDAVTVTGTTSATKIKNTPQPVTIISKNDLFKNSSTNIIEALSKTVNGFSILTTGPAIAKPLIRGLGSNRMVTINDGVRQEGQQWGEEHGIEIDEQSVQQVEILKGPSSLMYGSDAIAGVLNIITNKPIQVNTIKANISSAYLDNNKMYSVFSNVAGNLNNGFNWNIYNSYKSAADYSNAYDGKVFNSRFKENNFGGYVGLNKTWGYTHLLFSSFNQKLGIITGARDSITGQFVVFPESLKEHIATSEELNSREILVPYQTINHAKVALDNNFIFSGGRLTSNIAYQHNQRKEFANVNAPSTPDLFFDLKTINYNLQYHFNEFKDWKTSIGFNGMFQQNKNLAHDVLIPNYKQFDFGGFVVTKKSFNNITTNFGIRYDYRSLKSEQLFESGNIRFQALNKTFNNFTGSIGLAFQANEQLTLKLNLARGFRAPNMIELSSNGAHEGTNRYEYGNKNLQSENSYQADAGLEFNAEHVSFSINTFYTAYNNFIFTSKLSNANGTDSITHYDGEDFYTFQYKQNNARFIGFEANVDFHPHPLDWLHVENSISFVRGKFNNNYFGAENIPFMPAAKWLSDIRIDVKGKLKFVSNAFVKIEMENQFAQNNIFNVANTETATPAYTLLNFSFGTDFKINTKQKINLFFSINNITDVTYQNHLSRLKYTDVNNSTQRMGVFNMGRNINVKINIPLSFNL
jgi:iron complex outermembrane recepter protein